MIYLINEGGFLGDFSIDQLSQKYEPGRILKAGDRINVQDLKAKKYDLIILSSPLNLNYTGDFGRFLGEALLVSYLRYMNTFADVIIKIDDKKDRAVKLFSDQSVFKIVETRVIKQFDFSNN